MSKIKALVLYTLGFLSALLLFIVYDHKEEAEIQVIQEDYTQHEYSLFAGACTVQPKIKELPEVEEVELQVVGEPEPELVDLGEFRITYYDNCEQCCGEWAQYHTTFTGTELIEHHTCAVDPSIIPLGTVLEINGETYTAEDTGAFEGRIIDIYVGSHEEGYVLAAQYGDYAEVYMKEDM